MSQGQLGTFSLYNFHLHLISNFVFRNLIILYYGTWFSPSVRLATDLSLYIDASVLVLSGYTVGLPRIYQCILILQFWYCPDTPSACHGFIAIKWYFSHSCLDTPLRKGKIWCLFHIIMPNVRFQNFECFRNRMVLPHIIISPNSQPHKAIILLIQVLNSQKHISLLGNTLKGGRILG